MDQKKMKNIKKPAYGCTMAKGLFAGANWVCIKCGRQAPGYSSMPSAQAYGRCPDTASGNHVWQQC